MNYSSDPQHYNNAQGVVVAALIADLQKGGGEIPLIKTLSEDMAIPRTAFGNTSFSQFYQAYQGLWARSQGSHSTIDSVQVLSELERMGVPPHRIDKWKAHLLSPKTAASGAIVRDTALFIRDMGILTVVKDDLHDWLSKVEKDASHIGGKVVALTNVLLSRIGGNGEIADPRSILASADAEGYKPPVSTGWNTLDRMMSGDGAMESGGFNYHSGDLVVWGAPSGHGKSTAGCNVAVNMVRQGVGCLYFTWEMAKPDLLFRMLCNHADIPYGVAAFPDGPQATEEYRQRREESIQSIASLVRVYERPQTVEEIKEVVYRHKVEMGEQCAVVVLDHIGIPVGDDENWLHLQNLSYDLKTMAKEMHVAAICLSQVPPEVENELKKKNHTTIHRFRGSNAIYMAADWALFMCRHNGKNKHGNPDPTLANKTVIQMSKDRRFGHQETALLDYNKNRYRIEET